MAFLGWWPDWRQAVAVQHHAVLGLATLASWMAGPEIPAESAVSLKSDAQ
jgi:hypothetical protein